MNITIKENFNADLHGFSGVAIDKNWGATGMKLMDKMWKEVRSKSLRNKGINVWVYEAGDKMFAGVELEAPPGTGTELEFKKIHLIKYASYKHIGPYSKIGEACSKARDEMNQKGLRTCLPYLEIYGHWTEDESKLETDLLWCLE